MKLLILYDTSMKACWWYLFSNAGKRYARSSTIFTDLEACVQEAKEVATLLGLEQEIPIDRR